MSRVRYSWMPDISVTRPTPEPPTPSWMSATWLEMEIEPNPNPNCQYIRTEPNPNLRWSVWLKSFKNPGTMDPPCRRINTTNWPASCSELCCERSFTRWQTTGLDGHPTPPFCTTIRDQRTKNYRTYNKEPMSETTNSLPKVRHFSHSTIFGLHFCCRQYRCIFSHFYVIRPECYRIRWNYAAVRDITPFKVIQGHRAWYQSKAHMRLPISD